MNLRVIPFTIPVRKVYQRSLSRFRWNLRCVGPTSLFGLRLRRLSLGFGLSVVRSSLPRPQFMRSSGRAGIFLGNSCRGFIGFSLIVGPTRRWRFASLGAGFFRISVDGVDCSGAGSVLLLLVPVLRGIVLPVIFM